MLIKKYLVKLICWLYKDSSLDIAYDIIHKSTDDILDTPHGVQVARLFRSSYRLALLTKKTINYEETQKFTLLSHELKVSKRTLNTIEHIIKEELSK